MCQIDLGGTNLSMSKKYVSWNVNSVRIRLPLILKMIQENQPDIIMLQELKCTNELFPCQAFPDYRCHVYGQKAWNGVAILVRNQICVTSSNHVQIMDDNDARCIEVIADGTRFISVYVPCGSDAKFTYKQLFLEKLYLYLKQYIDMPVVIGGDFNVALTDEHVQYPLQMKSRLAILCAEEFRLEMRSILEYFADSSDPCDYTWWDYRYLYQYQGAHIDYILSRNLSEQIQIKALSNYRRIIINNSHIITKPSDHVPILLTHD